MALMKDIRKMSMWEDVSVFKGVKVEILKRAQLVIADLWYCGMQSEPETELSKLCKFHDISELTAFADYRIPQTLLNYGAIKYSEKLLQMLKGK